MNRSSTLLVAALALIGCEHKSKTVEATGSGSAGGMAMQPEPVGRDKTAPPSGAEQVRPPVAADLAEYTKDIPGNGDKLFVAIETSLGTFHCELFPKRAPITVANFVGLATGKKAWTDPSNGQPQRGKPFFNDLTFHRVIPQFMIQGGDPMGKGVGGPGYQFEDEFHPDDDMKMGTLAMANAGPTTNGSQFFITENAPKHLNGKHTIFGQCNEVDLVKKITGVDRDPGDKPTTPVKIVTVTFSKNG